MTETAPPPREKPKHTVQPRKSHRSGYRSRRAECRPGGRAVPGRPRSASAAGAAVIGCYPERLTGFWLTFWIGVAGSALAGLGFTASGARGWSVSRRRFVAAVGAASFAWGFEVHKAVLSDRTSLRGGRLQVVAVGNERTTTSWESVSPSAFQMPCAQLTERRACGALSSINALVWPVTA